GVFIERLVYETRPGLLGVSYLLRPIEQDRPLPAVLCPPGHGDGVRSLIFDWHPIYKRYPLDLVRRGFVAVVPEHRGFGERATGPKSHAVYCHALNLLGESALGFNLYDVQRALDIVASLREVDADRIGCYGMSLGGELARLLAALEDRLRAACVS